MSTSDTAPLAANHWLGALLAVLHRDGGQYQEEQGTEQATRDAITQHYERVTELDRLTWERDLYRNDLERIAGQWAQPARDIARMAIEAADERRKRTR